MIRTLKTYTKKGRPLIMRYILSPGFSPIELLVADFKGIPAG
jgi:hypothetical protein